MKQSQAVAQMGNDHRYHSMQRYIGYFIKHKRGQDRRYTTLKRVVQCNCTQVAPPSWVENNLVPWVSQPCWRSLKAAGPKGWGGGRLAARFVPHR
jgi:hypothetical protein